MPRAWYHRNMNCFRRCCIRIIRQVRISRRTIDALPKSLHIGVLSSFGGKAPLVLANTSSTGNYDCRFASHAYKGCMPRASCSVFDRIIEI